MSEYEADFEAPEPPQPEIDRYVAMMRAAIPAARQRTLQNLIGSRDVDKHKMHFRALLLAALREQDLWPPKAWA